MDRALVRYFFNFAWACRYFGGDKFLDSVRFIVRSHLSGCVRCTCTSGKNIAAMANRKYIRSAHAGNSRNEKNCRIREMTSCHVFDYADRSARYAIWNYSSSGETVQPASGASSSPSLSSSMVVGCRFARCNGKEN